MRLLARVTLPAAGLLLAAATAAHAQFAIYGVTNGANGMQRLVRFGSGDPSGVTTLGLTGANLVGIDFRPATGVLYGYDGNLLYTIDLGTGAATPAFDVGDAAGNPGFDFNPVVDRIRVVGDAGTNLRIDPNDGATTVDGGYTYAPGDPNAGQTPSLTGAAYTNSDTDPSTGTTLYGIDRNRGTLAMITAPNGGIISTVGGLGLGFVSVVDGFDIVTVGGVNTAFLTATNRGGFSSLYTVNLGTGAATFVRGLDIPFGVQGIAVASTVPEPGTLGLLAVGLAAGGAILRRRGSRG